MRKISIKKNSEILGDFRRFYLTKIHYFRRKKGVFKKGQILGNFRILGGVALLRGGKGRSNNYIWLQEAG